MSIKDLVADVLGIPVKRIPDNATLGTLRGWDSISHINIVSTIEDRFSITLSQGEILEMTSLTEIAAVLRSKGIALDADVD